MNGAQTSVTMKYEVTASLQIVRKQCILNQLASGVSEEEENALKEELLRLDVAIERIHTVQQANQAKRGTIEGSHVPSLQDPNEMHRIIYKPMVEERLREYKKAKAKIPILTEQLAELEAHMAPIEASLTASYTGMLGGGDSRYSKVEAAVLEPFNQLSSKRAELFKFYAIIHEMEDALDQLPEYERLIIHNDYLVPRMKREKARILYTRWNLGKTQFYVYKQHAIDAIARALQII